MTTIADLFADASVPNHLFNNAPKEITSSLASAGVSVESRLDVKNLNFGIAAKCSIGIRSGLIPVIPNPNDQSMRRRFDCAIAKWLGNSIVGDLTSCEDIPFINNFPFIPGQCFKEVFKSHFHVSRPQENLITVSIDEFIPRSAMKVPSGTTDIELIITVASCMLHGGTRMGTKTVTILIPFNEKHVPAYLLKFPVHMPAGSLTVTAARIIYYNRENHILAKITETDLTPAATLNARYFF